MDQFGELALPTGETAEPFHPVVGEPSLADAMAIISADETLPASKRQQCG